MSKQTYDYPEFTGRYIKKDIFPTRIPEGDSRREYVDAAEANSTFEDYFSTVENNKIGFTTSNGRDTSVTAREMMRYFLMHGWVEFQKGSKEAEMIKEIREAYKHMRDTRHMRRKRH